MSREQPIQPNPGPSRRTGQHGYVRHHLQFEVSYAKTGGPRGGLHGGGWRWGTQLAQSVTRTLHVVTALDGQALAHVRNNASGFPVLKSLQQANKATTRI